MNGARMILRTFYRLYMTFAIAFFCLEGADSLKASECCRTTPTAPTSPNPSSLDLRDNPFRYSGYYRDSESDLCCCKARYFSPETESFTSRDTYDLHNRYAYCNDNPVMETDPEGHDAGAVLGYVVAGALPSAFFICVGTAMYRDRAIVKEVINDISRIGKRRLIREEISLSTLSEKSAGGVEQGSLEDMTGMAANRSHTPVDPSTATDLVMTVDPAEERQVKHVEDLSEKIAQVEAEMEPLRQFFIARNKRLKSLEELQRQAMKSTTITLQERTDLLKGYNSEFMKLTYGEETVKKTKEFDDWKRQLGILKFRIEHPPDLKRREQYEMDRLFGGDEG